MAEGEQAVVSPRGRLRAAPLHHPDDAAYEPDRTVTCGDLEEVADFFESRLWSDGLPFVPPTPGRVSAMVEGADRGAGDLLGVVGDEQVEATVWSAAVNAVMAGCRPVDFPVVLAVAGLLADPGFRARDAGSTTGWEVLVLLSGPDLAARGFGVGAAVLRHGRRASSSVGRFARLWLRNLAGVVGPPGVTDMSAFGQPFLPVLAEDDEALDGLGWSSCRHNWGCPDAALAVGVVGVAALSAPIYTDGAEAEGHLDQLAAAVAGSSAFYAGCGATGWPWTPVLAVTPAVAEVLARAGLAKRDVAEELAARALAPAATVARGLAALGLEPAAAPGDAPVPVIPDPAALTIMVAGNPGRNQSKYVVPAGRAGALRVARVGAGDPRGAGEPAGAADGRGST